MRGEIKIIEIADFSLTDLVASRVLHETPKNVNNINPKWAKVLG